MKTLFISLLFIPQLVWSANFDVKCKSTVLNDTQVKSLPTGAVQILPSAPSGSFYLLQRIIVAPRQGNLDYGNFDPTPVILFSYGARNLYRCVLTHLVGSAYDPDDILDFSGDRIWSFPVGSYQPFVDNDGLVFPILTPANEHVPLYVWMINNFGNLTGGDSRNSMTITVIYSTLPIP